MARDGVRVSVLTNALEATDVPAVHAGYGIRRKSLLEAGVRMFELRRESAPPPAGGRWTTGSSASSLHAKTMAVDDTHVFIGTNFDPRSARLNTESGLVIESGLLATRLAGQFATEIPARSYEVQLRNDRLAWVQQQQDVPIVWTSEPHSSLWLRLQVWFLSLLPIEGLL
jgi:putative cardiolipin synthase